MESWLRIGLSGVFVALAVWAVSFLSSYYEWKGKVDAALNVLDRQVEARARTAAIEATKNELGKSERIRLLNETRKDAEDVIRRFVQAEEYAIEKARDFAQKSEAGARATEEILSLKKRLERDINLVDIDERLSKALKDPAIQEAIIQRVQIPSGAVVAFNLVSGCPKGWSLDPSVAGRVIIGAGNHQNLDERGARLSNYNVGKQGGVERRQLSISTLPRHTHQISDPQHSHSTVQSPSAGTYTQTGAAILGGHGGVTPMRDIEVKKASTGISVVNTGLGKPFGILPPYIALFFCKKDLVRLNQNRTCGCWRISIAMPIRRVERDGNLRIS